jgi:hypothetical protein
MKRYKRLKENYIDEGHNFFEKVQKPENYLKIIKKYITEFNNKNEFLNLDDLITSLNSYFLNEKLVFRKSEKTPKYNSGVVSMGYQPKTNEIYIFYCDKIQNAFKIQNKQYDYEYFEIFLENFIMFLGHEIIHRMQLIKDKTKTIGAMSHENKRKYLAKPIEIMAHAWEIVQEFKFNNRTNSDIQLILKSKRDEENLKWIFFSKRLEEYYKTFPVASNTMKLLYKYIYLYTEE